MAKFYFGLGNTTEISLMKICGNANDEQYFLNSNQAEIIDVSDDVFSKIKKETHRIESRNGSTITLGDISQDTDAFSVIFDTSDNLRAYLNRQSSDIAKWIKKNTNHAKKDSIQTYKNYIDSFDTTTVDYTTVKTWGQICEDNSVTHYNILELPSK